MMAKLNNFHCFNVKYFYETLVSLIISIHFQFNLDCGAL